MTVVVIFLSLLLAEISDVGMSLLGFAIFFCILASGRTRSNEVLLNYHPFGLV